MTDVFTSGWGWNVPAPVVPRCPPTMRAILDEVCAKHRLPVREVTGERRHIPLVRARQEFMWRCRQVKSLDGGYRFTLPQIGRFLAVDHTTVLHGVRAHAKRMAAHCDA